MLNKEWYCNVCKIGCNYKLVGKICYLRMKKYIKNVNIIDIMNKIIDIIYKK